MPDISVIMAYFQRPLQLRNTLESYRHFYGSDLDYEVVIVDDSSYKHQELLDLLKEFEDIKFVTEYVDRKSRQVRGPGVVMNRAAELASSPILALTNPENLHLGPVLTDAVATVKRGAYRVYACRTLREIPRKFEFVRRDPESFTDKGVMNGWYVHSKHYPRQLHFMSAIHAEDWRMIGGFDPEFDNGCGYDDDDLVESIKHAGLNIEIIDDPHVAHQWHARQHWDFRNATAKNFELFKTKWGKK